MNINIDIKIKKCWITVHGPFHDHELLYSFEIYTDDNCIHPFSQHKNYSL